MLLCQTCPYLACLRISQGSDTITTNVYLKKALGSHALFLLPPTDTYRTGTAPGRIITPANINEPPQISIILHLLNHLKKQ